MDTWGHLPAEIARIVVRFSAPDVWNLRAVDRRTYNECMGTPFAFVDTMCRTDQANLLQECEREGHVQHVSDRSSACQCRTQVIDFAFVCRNACTVWAHHRFLTEPCVVSTMAVRQCVRQKMPGDATIRRLRTEHAVAVQMADRLAALRRRVMEQLLKETRENLVTRTELRTKIRNNILRRVLLRRISGNVRARL